MSTIFSSFPVTRVIAYLIYPFLYPLREFYLLLCWIFWLCTSLIVASGHKVVVLFTCMRISISILLYIVVLAIRRFVTFNREVVHQLSTLFSPLSPYIPFIPRPQPRTSTLNRATSYKEFARLAHQLDRLTDNEQWKYKRESREYDYLTLEIQTQSLVRCRVAGDVRGLMFTLQNVFYRKFCHLDNYRLYDHTHIGTKFLIEDFYSRCVEQLSFICTTNFPSLSTRAKLRFFQRARKSYGKSALLLSGGGSLAMYHIGVIKALNESHCLPQVIAGTSGGSIVAGVLAIKTDVELKEPALLSPLYLSDQGQWLPSLDEQFKNFWKKRVLIDSKDFIATAKAFFGDYTFEEAYRRSSRDVSITVSLARSAALQSHPLVLNHITSPNVLIWSAVTSSCALPGLFEPQPLWAKEWDGRLTPYFPVGVECVDGSLQADLPMRRLTELFNVQNFIVSQVNPHVSPFIRHTHATSSTPYFSLFTSLERFLQADLMHRLKRLAKLKVIPKIYGQDFTPVFTGMQQYTGDITIVPEIEFHLLLKALQQPTKEDLTHYIRQGELAAWREMTSVQNALIIERTLDECVRVCTKRIQKEDKMGRANRLRQKKGATQNFANSSNKRSASEPGLAIREESSSNPIPLISSLSLNVVSSSSTLAATSPSTMIPAVDVGGTKASIIDGQIIKIRDQSPTIDIINQSTANGLFSPILSSSHRASTSLKSSNANIVNSDGSVNMTNPDSLHSSYISSSETRDIQETPLPSPSISPEPSPEPSPINLVPSLPSSPLHSPTAAPASSAPNSHQHSRKQFVLPPALSREESELAIDLDTEWKLEEITPSHTTPLKRLSISKKLLSPLKSSAGIGKTASFQKIDTEG